VDLSMNQENQSNNNPILRHLTVRLEKMSAQIRHLEDKHSREISELHEKYANLNERLARTRFLEGKIQELIDQHNRVVQGFELKLSQLKRLIDDQEMQIYQAQAELKVLRK